MNDSTPATLFQQELEEHYSSITTIESDFSVIKDKEIDFFNFCSLDLQEERYWNWEIIVSRHEWHLHQNLRECPPYYNCLLYIHETQKGPAWHQRQIIGYYKEDTE